MRSVRQHLVRSLGLLASVAATAGCLDAGLLDGKLCDEHGACLPGYQCLDGVCRRSSDGGPAAMTPALVPLLGGGGAAGRIRINTAAGSARIEASALLSPADEPQACSGRCSQGTF